MHICQMQATKAGVRRSHRTDVITTLKVVAAGFRPLRGLVLAFNGDGLMIVQNEVDQTSVACRFLSMSAAPPPPVVEGDAVLYLQDPQGGGFVLGVIPADGVRDRIPERLCLRAEHGLELS